MGNAIKVNCHFVLSEIRLSHSYWAGGTKGNQIMEEMIHRLILTVGQLTTLNQLQKIESMVLAWGYERRWSQPIWIYIRVEILGKTRKTSVRITGIAAEIRTGYLHQPHHISALQILNNLSQRTQKNLLMYSVRFPRRCYFQMAVFFLGVGKPPPSHILRTNPEYHYLKTTYCHLRPT